MSTTAPDNLQIGVMLTGLAGGLALFLYGMRMMTDSLKIVAGGGMKTLLAKLTANRFTASLAGALITAVIQSSSVTTVLVVGFISAGLMGLSQGVGVILGANIGTTITAQIIAFKVTKYAMLMIAVGFLMEALARREKVRHYGAMLMGLGLLFFGMDLMSQATYPLRSYQPFIDLMREMQAPIWGILIGTVFTALVQSSSATTGIVIVLAGQGYISLEAGIALLFGANVGTCVTVMLSSIGKPREAVQAAVVHVIFNVLGVVAWVLFIRQFAEVVRWISPAAAHLSGTERLAEESPRQIANAHTLFNVITALAFLPFTNHLARLANWLVPKRPEPAPEAPVSRYIDPIYLDQSALALDRVRMELASLGSSVLEMVDRAWPATTRGKEEELTELENMDDGVDRHHGEIVTFLGDLSLKNLIDPTPDTIQRYLAAANYIENIGDVVETNLVANARDRLRDDLRISDPTLEILKPVYDKGRWAIATALEALDKSDQQLADKVMRDKDDFYGLADQAHHHLSKRLVADAPNRLATFRMETNIIDDLKRIHTLARRIARQVKPESEDTPES